MFVAAALWIMCCTAALSTHWVHPDSSSPEFCLEHRQPRHFWKAHKHPKLGPTVHPQDPILRGNKYSPPTVPFHEPFWIPHCSKDGGKFPVTFTTRMYRSGGWLLTSFLSCKTAFTRSMTSLYTASSVRSKLAVGVGWSDIWKGQFRIGFPEQLMADTFFLENKNQKHTKTQKGKHI